MNYWERVEAYAPSRLKQRTDGMQALRELFPIAEADYMNFVLFSTSGVHGSYQTIEEAEAAKDPFVTFLVVQPRLVKLMYGNCNPVTPGDFKFLKQLRKSSWQIVQTIGANR